MFCVWYEIIDLHVMQVGQLGKNTCLFILTDLGGGGGGNVCFHCSSV